MKRWIVEATYRTEGGDITDEYRVDEISEVHALIEKGPNWEALKSITIRFAYDRGLTISEADTKLQEQLEGLSPLELHKKLEEAAQSNPENRTIN